MWNKIGGFIGIVTILGLVVAILELSQSNKNSQKQDSAQTTQIAILEQQLEVNREMATLQAGALNSDSAATAVVTRVAELESTAIVLATMQSVAQATEQSVPKDELIYEDTFDTSSGWYLKEGVKIENGNLLVYPGHDAVPDFSNTFTDFTFKSRFYITSFGSMAFYFRNQVPTCQNGNWNCSIQIVLDFKSQSQTFVARRYLGNTLSPIDITRTSINALRLNDWNEILVTTKGNNYKVYINRSLVLEFSESEYSSGSFIIDNDPNSSSEIKLDYIRIYKVQ